VPEHRPPIRDAGYNVFPYDHIQNMPQNPTGSNMFCQVQYRKPSCYLQFSVFCLIPTINSECLLNSGMQKVHSRSHRPRGLRRRSAAARLLRSWVRIPRVALMSVCCECSVLSGRGLCDELISRPDESYRLWCVVVCDLETSRMRRPCPTGEGGRPVAPKTKKKYINFRLQRRLVAELSPRNPGFDSWTCHVSSMEDKVALGKVLLRALLFYPVNISPP
jgi:hypothetical protein